MGIFFLYMFKIYHDTIVIASIIYAKVNQIDVQNIAFSLYAQFIKVGKSFWKSTNIRMTTQN